MVNICGTIYQQVSLVSVIAVKAPPPAPQVVTQCLHDPLTAKASFSLVVYSTLARLVKLAETVSIPLTSVFKNSWNTGVVQED